MFSAIRSGRNHFFTDVYGFVVLTEPINHRLYRGIYIIKFMHKRSRSGNFVPTTTDGQALPLAHARGVITRAHAL